KDDQAFDFVQAKEKLPVALEAVKKVEEALSVLANEYENLTIKQRKINDTEVRMQSYVAQEQLRLVDENPFQKIDAARRAYDTLERVIEEGQAMEAKRASEQLETLVEEAEKSVRTLVKYRDETKENLSLLQTNIRPYLDLDSSFQGILARVKDHYAPVHWDHLPKQYARFKEMTAEIDDQLPKIEHWLK